MCCTPKNSGLANHARRVSETSIDYKLLKRASNLADQRERERKRAQAVEKTGENPDVSTQDAALPLLKKRKLSACQRKHGMARFMELLRPFYT